MNDRGITEGYLMLFGSPDYWNWKQKIMAQEETEYVLPAIEFDAVTGWRFGYLSGLGFDPETALRLAESPEVDLRRAEELVKKGCPLETAVGILL